MVDLPRAQEMVSEVAELIRGIGGNAQGHAENLAEQLTLIIARSHEADELMGAATGRLATQIGRIETRTERTARSIEEAGAQLSRSIDTTIDNAGAAVEGTRIALDSQREAMEAMVAHGRAALEDAGSAAAAALAERLGDMARQTESLAKYLADQDASRARARRQSRICAGRDRKPFRGVGRNRQRTDRRSRRTHRQSQRPHR